jgi:dynein heavy chain
MNNFRKTAQNFHYEFNIRHISNVFQGLLVSQPAQFLNPEKFVHLWLHESERVYGDRLVSYEDLTKYNAIVQAQHKKVRTCIYTYNNRHNYTHLYCIYTLTTLIYSIHTHTHTRSSPPTTWLVSTVPRTPTP